MAAERAGDPLDLALVVHAGALGVQVVHVLRPVLDGRITQVRALAHEELHGARVQVGHVVLRCRATLDEVQVGVVLHDDERVFELTRALGIQAEVALEGEVELRAGGHVDERAAAPHRAMERGELVVRGRDERHELLADERLPAGLVERLLDTGVDDAQLRGRVLHVVVHELRVVLRAHAGEVAALCLGDAQALKGVLDVVGHFVPGGALIRVGLHIGDDVVHVEPGDGGAQVGFDMRW